MIPTNPHDNRDLIPTAVVAALTLLAGVVGIAILAVVR